MRDRLHVLVVDDDADVRAHLASVLTREHASVVHAASAMEATAALGREVVDVVILDVNLPDGSGLDVIAWARGAEIDTEFVVVTGQADIETAVEAMRRGAYDFVTKPFKNAELVETVHRAAEKKALRRENCALKEVITRREGVPHVVGESPEIHDVMAMIGRLAAHDSTVLILGESGTGKELVARSIHLRSRRAGRPFVSVNCGALPDSLLETELFGHKKGAFTGAVTSRVGLFEAADGGTLFLDEIGEMSPAMQVRLLRTLDSGEVRRVGEERSFHVDVRIVSATAKDLQREAGEGRFRWDLYYRVSTVVLSVPPLRRRPADLTMLIRHFTEPYARQGKALRFSEGALDRMRQYGWPGNIRELRNLVERLQILHEGGEVTAADLPPEFAGTALAETADPALVPLTEMERRYVERVLRATDWNKAQAARILGVDIKTLNKKIRDSDITRPA